MTNFNESIDTNIFMALQISRKCMELGETIPNILLMSNIGVGKSTAISYFAEINNYDLVLLRISNETPDTITGYDIAANTEDPGTTSAKHIRPSWFQKILDNSKRGVKSLLFLDELTTADAATQGAALNLVFDRKCHAEYLPEDTLVVAAGNYANNLSSEMTVLAPMLNRFIVFNIMPSHHDLKHFLCKYEGSILGKRMDFRQEIKNAMISLKEQENKSLTKEQINIIGEYIQRGLLAEASAQMKQGLLDPKVTELKDLYSMVDNDEPLANIFSFRSINYLLDAALACFICFGKEGLLSDNFKNIIHGTVGLALSRDANGEVKKNIVTDRYYAAFVNIASDLVKLGNSALPEYKSFISNLLDPIEASKEKVFDIPTLNLFKEKLTELMADNAIKNIDRPIDEDVLQNACTFVRNTIRKKVEFSLDRSKGTVEEVIKADPGNLINKINTWNHLVGMFCALDKLVRNPEKRYSVGIRDAINQVLIDFRQTNSNLRIIMKQLDLSYPEVAATMPAIKTWSIS